MTDRQEMEKHQIKKSSYYVWFLGAKESRGLRGDEFISPVVNHLMGKELQQPPIKVTLQLSNKGLKIIQNVSGKRIHDTYRVSILIKPTHTSPGQLRIKHTLLVILLSTGKLANNTS